MNIYLVKAVRKVFPLAFLAPEGEEGVRKIGHREYIGGYWEEIGGLQFDFLKSHGLRPEHYLLDIACGSLRLGVKAIPYLEAGHYLGIEKESVLLAAGLTNELDQHVREEKRPRVEISDAFEFERFGQKVDYAIAQALFCHLTPAMIEDCFRRLYPVLVPGGLFYATYFQVDAPRSNPDRPHAHGYFAYTVDEMMEFGRVAGYEARYIGEWEHPRGQVMVEYRKL
ncbi:MAG: class I SAM-dependent methyltransferase [Halioglobus sp.]|nr:class I SAM-dependent methyltransferase [Halioglobus sp.]